MKTLQYIILIFGLVFTATYSNNSNALPGSDKIQFSTVMKAAEYCAAVANTTDYCFYDIVYNSSAKVWVWEIEYIITEHDDTSSNTQYSPHATSSEAQMICDDSGTTSCNVVTKNAAGKTWFEAVYVGPDCGPCATNPPEKALPTEGDVTE